MRILIGLVVLALALPASGAIVNGSFEDGLTGWTCTNVMINPSSYVPDPDFIDGENRAGDSNCNARDSSGLQEASCDVNPALDCVLTGYLAGGAPGGLTYWVKVNGTKVIELSGVNDWHGLAGVPYDQGANPDAGINLGPCVGQTVEIEFGSTGDGAWGAAGYHVDAFVLECIPEPGTGLSLLLLAGLPLLRRRR